MLGQVVGNYRILRQLGEGGMGAVYLAEHALLGRRAAIKVLLPALSQREDVIARFFNEARAATTIGDPGIVQVFDFGQHTDGSAYLVMELLDGEALDRRLQRVQRLAPADALRITRQIAATLGAAHAKGIIHRDLKPENVFMVRDGEVAGGERAKILDFGIAKLTGADGSLSKTRTGALMGTPVYMSPEQCRGAGDLDHRSDIYALGCVLYHLITGRPPFSAGGLGELLAMHMIVPAPPPSTIVPELGADLDALMARLLAKNPDDRFATMADLASAIDELVTGSPVAASMAEGGWRTPVPPPPAGSWANLTPAPAAPVPGAFASMPGPVPAVAASTGPGAPMRSRTPTTLGSAAAETVMAANGATTAAPRRRSGTIKLAAAVTLLALGVGGVWLVGARTSGPDRASEGETTTAATPPVGSGGPVTAESAGGGVGVVEEGHGAGPAAAGEGSTAEGAVDAGIDATSINEAEGPTLPPVAAPIGVATTGAASPSQRRDRDRERRAARAHEAAPTTTPATAPAPAPTPPPPRPACKLDEYGVPLERC